MVRKYLSFVKFAHTLFALPFALVAYFSASYLSGSFDWKILGLVVLCMVFARNAAMGFNRYIDRKFDEQNERTKIREIPSGQISPFAAFAFVFINAMLFVASTWFINPVCFYLSPVALLVILGYSLTKRFTALCHFVLGLGLSLAPVGAWLAVTGTFAWPPVVLGIAVLTWVSGFDIIYALQDEEFDRTSGLFSIPAWLGKSQALNVSNILHVITALLIGLFGYLIDGSYLLWAGTIFFWGLLIYQHMLVKPNDLSKVNLAFFTTNGIGSVTFAAFVVADWLLRG